MGFGEIVHDLPGGEWRRVNYAEGYKAILVNGEPTFEDDQCTGPPRANFYATVVAERE